MKFTKVEMFIIALALGLAIVNPAHSALVVNGSFEATPMAGSWQQFSAVQGWTSNLSGLNAFEVQKGASQGGIGGFIPFAAEGKQYLELNTTGLSSVSQTIQTMANGRYSLNFAYAGRPDTAGGAASLLNVYWGNVKLNDAALLGQTSGQWSFFNFDNLLASGSATTLRFESVGPVSAPTYGSYLDAVAVTAVPEPGTYAMFLLGLGVLGATVRRRRHQQGA